MAADICSLLPTYSKICGFVKSSERTVAQFVLKMDIARRAKLWRKALLLSLLYLRYKKAKKWKSRTMWVHPIVQLREEKGHFNHLYQEGPETPQSSCILTLALPEESEHNAGGEQENIAVNNPVISSAFSPEAVRPLPKACPRKSTKKGRRSRKSTIYTDSPEKEAISKEYDNRLKRTNANQIKKRLDDGKAVSNCNKNKKTKHESSSSEQEECFCLVCMSTYSESRPRKK